MSSIPQPGTLQASASTTDADSSSNTLSWEGDRMFNIYIYDYCYKRGYRKTARELLQEAGIPPESHPPIDARQGLLFEWWSVFWVLFTAKANGSGPEEAMVYTQHQAQQAANRAARQTSAAGTAMPSQAGQGIPGQPQLNRPGVNGVQQGPRSFMSGNVPMANGVGPNPGGIPQMNGMPAGPLAAPSTQPGQPPSFQQQGALPGQQPRNQIGVGAPGAAPRPPNGLSFQSPTMAHSPQNAGGHPQPPQTQSGPQQNQQNPHVPMNQLGPGGRSPQMGVRSGMLPPNAPGTGIAPGQPSGPGPNQTPASFQSLGRPPSRTASPGQGNMMTQPSPSMANRQPPGMNLDASMMQELSRTPAPILESLKKEAGIDVGKELNAMTPEEKMRLVNVHRRRKLGPTATNLAAGASNVMLPPNQRVPGPGPAGGRPAKRNSTSGEEPETAPGVGSSPPDSKRPRRSPMDTNYPHQSPMIQQGQQPGGPGGPGGPQQPQGQPMQNGVMKPGGPPLGSSFMGSQGMSNPMGVMGMGMNNGGMGQPPMGGMPQHQMGNTISPAMGGPMPGQNMMNTPQMQPMGVQNQQQYRASLTTFHRNMGGIATGSPGSDPSFNVGNMPGQVPRPGGPPFDPNRQKPMGMLPPPSPKDIKDAKPEGSPHNAPNAGRTPTATGTASSTPNLNPAQPVPPLHQQPGPQSQGPTPNPNQSMAPSPTPMQSMNMVTAPPPPPTSDIGGMFATDFLNNVAGALDDFVDGGLFRPENDINFERDFGQWFNPDDVAGISEMGK